MRPGRSDLVLFVCFFTAASVLGLGLASAALRGKTLEFTAIPETGIARLILDVRKLPVSGTVLQIGAHPDDEDNALMAWLSKGLHVDTYYLVATWGEGGQNEIGPELYDALGVLRSRELAAARAIDGASQLYLGACDFGFSKTGAEALAIWGHEEQLRRLVWFLRAYRPEIVLTHHDTVTGHGHHQAVGILIQEAFDAAADPTRFPEQMTVGGLWPWQVKKLYVSDSRNPTVQINEGEFNPVLGRSYAEIGALARSMHKCQGMGGAAGAKGDLLRGYRLVKSALGKIPAKEESITDGLDFSLNRLAQDVYDRDYDAPAALTAINRKIVELNDSISSILAAFDPLAPTAVVGEALKGLALVRELEDMVAASSLTPATNDLIGQRLQAKENDFLQVLRGLSATSLDVKADDDVVVPGQTFTVTASFWNRGSLPVDSVRLSLDVPAGWVAVADGPVGASADRKAEARFKVTVSPGASFTGPFDPAPVKARATWQLMGTRLWTTADAETEARVLPAVAVSLDPSRLMVPAASSATTRVVSVRLRNNVKGAAKGQVGLTVPQGWTVSGEPGYAMKAEGEEIAVPFGVTIPAGTATGSYEVKATATYDGGSSSTSVQAISYPHIDTRHVLKPAACTVGVIDVKMAPDLKVGYVSSGFDKVPEALRQMGVDVTLLEPADLASGDRRSGDLSRYDTIVVGIRAYLSRPDLGANNSRLMDYVRNGGNLIVQYHKTGEMKPDQAPFPITISSNRVTVEGAPVTVLQPGHVLFNSPNELGPEDWDGWIQERGLYFPSRWAEQYTPLVAMSDPDEPVQNGCWLIADYGKGTYIYTALVWYRQLDGLVPGGYRAFANMISLPKVK